MNKQLIELKGETSQSITVVGNLNLLILVTDRKRQQKISKNIEELKILSIILTKLALNKVYKYLTKKQKTHGTLRVDFMMFLDLKM